MSACAIPASATLTTYSTPAALETALPSDTFSNITFAQGDLGTSTTDLGIVFSTNSPQLSGISTTSLGWPAAGTQTAIDTTYENGVYTITLSFPSGVDAIGFYVDSGVAGHTVSVSVTDSGGTATQPLTESGSTPSFFGVTTTDPTFTSFSITNNEKSSQDILTLGDVEIGQLGSEPDAAPEAATFLLVATGLFAIGYFRRRRVLRPAAA